MYVIHHKAVAPAPLGTGARAPHFYEWLGTGGTVMFQSFATAEQNHITIDVKKLLSL